MPGLAAETRSATLGARRHKERVMASVAEQYWREVLDMRRPLEPVERHHARRQRLVLVRGGRFQRERKR